MMNFGEMATQCQLDAVEQLKENVQGWKDKNYDHFWNYFRRLEECNFNVDKATKILKVYLRNRRILGVNKETMTADPSIEEKLPIFLFDPETVQKGAQLSSNKRYSNLCLSIIAFNKHSVYETIANHFRPADLQVQYYLQHILRHQTVMDRERRTNARSGTIAIVDIEEAAFGFRHVELFASLTQGVIELSQPKSVQAVIVLNAPSLIRKVVNVLMPLIGFEGLIHFLTPQEMIHSKHFQFNPKMIPKMYGGELVDSKGDPKCSEFVLQPVPELDYRYLFPSDQREAEFVALERNGTTIHVGRNQYQDVHFVLTDEALQNCHSLPKTTEHPERDQNCIKNLTGATFLQLHFIASAAYTLKIYHNSDDFGGRKQSENASGTGSTQQNAKQSSSSCKVEADTENLHFDFGPVPKLNVTDLVNIRIDQFGRPGRITIRFGYQSLKVFTKMKVTYTLKLVHSVTGDTQKFPV